MNVCNVYAHVSVYVYIVFFSLAIFEDLYFPFLSVSSLFIPSLQIVASGCSSKPLMSIKNHILPPSTNFRWYKMSSFCVLNVCISQVLWVDKEGQTVQEHSAHAAN